MGRRKRSADGDSLDLLLDTITNAFGGIVFLAIMVTVLLKNSAALNVAAPVETIPKPSRAKELAELIARREILEKSAIAKELVGRLADPELKQIVQELVTLRAQRDQLRLQRQQNQEQKANADASREEIVRTDRNIEQDLERKKQEIAMVEERLKAERASREVNSPFPEERSASKSEFAITVRYGRLYVNRIDGRANLDDFTVIGTEGNFLVLTPKPFAGTEILTSGRLSPAAINAIQVISANDYHITAIVWDDSFEHFKELRTYLTDQDYDCRILLQTEGDGVVESGAKDPQVQ